MVFSKERGRDFSEVWFKSLPRESCLRCQLWETSRSGRFPPVPFKSGFVEIKYRLNTHVKCTTQWFLELYSYLSLLLTWTFLSSVKETPEPIVGHFFLCKQLASSRCILVRWFCTFYAMDSCRVQSLWLTSLTCVLSVFTCVVAYLSMAESCFMVWLGHSLFCYLLVGSHLISVNHTTVGISAQLI